MLATTTPTSSDEQNIQRLQHNWGLNRDTGRWADLRASYTPDATMVTTWFDGSASNFVDASIRAAASGTLVQHFIGASTIEVREARALAETRLMLLVRAELGGVEVDVTCYGRFFDRLIRCDDGAWRIASRMPIYEKDSVLAVDARRAIDIDAQRLSTYPRAFRHLAYLQASGGATITTRIPGHNSDAQRQLYAAGHDWLQSGA